WSRARMGGRQKFRVVRLWIICLQEWILQVSTPYLPDVYSSQERTLNSLGDTLSFLMYHLSLPASRTLQSNFQASLDSLIPPGTTLPPAPTKSFLTALLAHPFIHAILHETFRFYPAIPLTLPRVVVQEGKHIDGVYIP